MNTIIYLCSSAACIYNERQERSGKGHFIVQI